MPRFALPLVLLSLLLAAEPLEAQKRCVKGIPCGNSCIAATKTCRIGTGSATPATKAPARDPAAVRRDSLAATARARAALQSAGQRPADSARAGVSPFVGDAARKVFFKRGCAPATKIGAVDLVVFATEAEAKAAGYARSGADGC